ncbi:efflux transporter periplasmic adaptor subunit [Opitutaceae bacterium EW11]|nr:efflux transporter periplasmic adaptor subunit [Opitutaceae bacterium EW11]
MKLRTVIVTAIVAVLILGALLGYKFSQIRKGMAEHAAMKIPPVTVSAATASAQTWPNSLAAVGSLTSFRGVMLKTELDGLVTDVAANSGAVVQQGEALVLLDTSAEVAQLKGLEAQAKLADLSLRRARELRENNTNSPADVDAAEATDAQAQALVDQLRVTIAKKHISAPFAGRLGIVNVYPGQYLSKGESLVVLESVDPIHVDFSLPQQDLPRLALGQEVAIFVDAFPGRTFTAKVSALSPRIDGPTRAVDIRATLSNPDDLLRPGMYARAEVMLPASEGAIVVPSAAIIHNPYGEAVFVIEQGRVQQRFVKTGPQRGDLVLVVDGLRSGEQVVTAGQIKLRNGSEVRVDNSAAPEGTATPKPTES